MYRYELEVYNNRFETKNDLRKFLRDSLEPLENSFTRSGTRLSIANISSGATDGVTEVEGFMRILWGLAADDSYEKDSAWWQRMRKGIINGTNPEHQDYYGIVGDFDQRLVEMASVGYSFVFRPECIYDPLSPKEKENLINWLQQINERQAHSCNWKFFRVMVDIGFEKLGLDYDQQKMYEYLDDLDAYYVSDGWYRDGDIDSAHVDYYGPFAMHYYGLFYAKFMKKIDPERAKRYEDRAIEFAKTFIYWFSKEGASLPYGRSLTYRYAQMGFWAMLLVSDVALPFDIGVVKGLIMRHLRWWNQQPIYNKAGHLTVGYTYPNQYMAEDYNAPGSVYWSLKGLILLTLADEHEFWSAKELPLPKLDESIELKVPRMLVCRDGQSDHVLAYNGGSFHTNAHTHVECKYEKFVYSTHFGFSVPKSHKTLAFGAFDNTLAVSEDGKYYRHKEQSIAIAIEGNIIKTSWSPFEDVIIETTLICNYPWHVREHKITTGRKLQVAEGGYAIGMEAMYGEEHDLDYRVSDLGVFITSNTANSCIVGYSEVQKPKVITAACNTNIMNPRTLIPTLESHLDKGVHILRSYVSGDRVSLLDQTKTLIDLDQLESMVDQAMTYNK